MLEFSHRCVHSCECKESMKMLLMYFDHYVNQYLEEREPNEKKPVLLNKKPAALLFFRTSMSNTIKLPFSCCVKGGNKS